MTTRRKLVAALEGQEVTIPDLLGLFPGWRYAVQPDVERVNFEIDKWLSTLNIEHATKQKHRQRGNYTLLAAATYPDTTIDKLLVISKLQYWIFFWDDDIDTGGVLAENKAETQSCCAATKACIDACLAPAFDQNASPPPGCRETIAILYPILHDMRAGMRPASFERLRRDLHEYVDGVARQQGVRIEEDLPNAEEYLRMRAADVGVKPGITQSEYAMSFALPQATYDSEAMQQILLLSAELTTLVNELLSLQKEARVGQLENITLLIAGQYSISLSKAVDRILDMIHERYELFTTAENQIAHENNGMSDEARQYIEVSRALVTGTVWWSYNCERYLHKSQLSDTGALSFNVQFPPSLQ